MRRFVLAALALSSLSLAGCTMFALMGMAGAPIWQADVYPDLTFDDVFVVAEAQIDRDYEIVRSDRQNGVIETAWDHGSISPQTRLLQREQVVVNLSATEDGVELRLRVRRQVKERLGLLAGEQENQEGWEEGRDDVERAEVLFGKIQAVLKVGRPSDDFYNRRRDPSAPSIDPSSAPPTGPSAP